MMNFVCIGNSNSLDVASSFNVLAFIIDPSLNNWDAYVDLNKEWKDKIARHLNDRCFYYNGIGIAWESKKECFLFNIHGGEWRMMCGSTPKSNYFYS